MEVSEAKVLITVDGARRKGKTAPIKSAVDAEIGAVETLQHIVVVRSTGTECEMQDGRDVWYDELMRGAPIPNARPSRCRPSTRSSSSTRQARPRSPRASCTPPAAT